MINALPLGLALLTAFLLYLSSPGPDCGFVAWVAVLPLLIICKVEKPGPAAFWGFTSGFLYHLALLYWIVFVLGKYGSLPLWLTIPALVLLAAYMALYPAFFSWLMSRTMTRVPPVWSAPVIWVGLDFVRGHLFSGFPWADLGYSQYLYPWVLQVADIAGHHGISFLVVLANSFLFTIVFYEADRETGLFKGRRKTYKRYHLLPALGILAAAALYNTVSCRQHPEFSTGPGVRVAVVQGNIEQDRKWLPENKLTDLQAYLLLSRAIEAESVGGVDLLVWPETALPFSPLHEPFLMETLNEELLADNNTPLLCGAPFYQADEKEPAVYNSGLLVTEEGIVQRYDKQHLVPFGEYAPLPNLLHLPKALVKTMGNFTAGNSSRPLAAGRIKAGMLICYESIFPEIARVEVREGANILVNITNDAWFGRSSAPVQHFSMAVLRAVENRRSLVRCANTGISGFIRPDGRIISTTPVFQACSLGAEMPLSEEITLFSRYGHNFSLLCALLIVPLALVVRRGKHGHPWAEKP